MHKHGTDKGKMLPVDLPRFHTDYAVRQRILGKVLKGKSKRRVGMPGWLRPAVSLAAAAALLLLLIVPFVNIPDYFSSGPSRTKIAPHWEQVAAENEIGEEAYVAALEMEVFYDHIRYQAIVIAGSPGRWTEYHINWDGGITLSSSDHTDFDVSSLPGIGLLAQLDWVGIDSLLRDKGYPAKISFAAAPFSATYTGQDQYVLVVEKGKPVVTSLQDKLAELSGPHSRLEVRQPGGTTTYYLPAGTYQVAVYPMETVLKVAALTDADAVHSYHRLEDGWLLDASVPGGRGLVWVDDEGNVSVKLWEEVQAEVLSATGLQLGALEFADGLLAGYATIRGSKQRLLLTHEYDIYFRPLDLVLAARGKDRVYHASSTELFVTDFDATRQLWQVPSGMIMGLAGLDRHVAVETLEDGVPHVTLISSDDGQVVARHENLRLQEVSFSPDGAEMLRLDTGLRLDSNRTPAPVWAAWSPDSSKVAILDTDGSFYVQSRRYPDRVLDGEGQVREAMWLDNSTIVLVCRDSIKLYQLNTRASKNILDLPEESLVGLSVRDGHLAVAVAKQGRGQVYVWEPDGGLLRQVLEINADEHQFVDSFSYSGSLLLFRTGVDRSRVLVLDPKNDRSAAIHVNAATPVWFDSNQLLLANGKSSEFVNPFDP